MRAPGEATGLDRARKRDRRNGRSLRHGPARVPAEELRRSRADHRQAVLLQGAARMLRPRRRALRLGAAAAGSPAQMRDDDGLLVGWGMGTATFPALMFQAAGARDPARRRHGVVEIGAARHGTGRLDRARADRRRQPRARSRPVEFRSGASDLPDGGIAGGSGHTATAGMAIHDAGGDADRQARRARHRRRALAAVRRRQRRRCRARRPAVTAATTRAAARATPNPRAARA